MNLKRDSSSQSPWQNNEQLTPITTSSTRQAYDIIIIGAGISGITTALLLQKTGKNCLVVDAGNLGFGTTGGTTAHLNTFFDSTYPEIESDFGKDATKAVAEAGKFAIELISSLVQEYQIDCDLEPKVGYLFSETEKESKQLIEIFDSAKNAGVDVEMSPSNGLPFSFLQCLKFEGQAQLHPLKYLAGLAKAFIALGGTIKENTFINEVKQEKDKCQVVAQNETYLGNYVVYATHIPPGINKFSFRCAPYRSYVLGIRLNDESQYPSDLSYDMQEPYHYFRTHVVNGEKILILGGADHKTGHSDPLKAFRELEKYANEHFDVNKILYQWSSQYYVPVDGLPYIGVMDKAEDRIFVATGYNGNGMTWGTVAGHLISELIQKNDHHLAQLFDPCRIKPIAGFSEFVKENADVAFHFVVDRFKAEDIDSFKDLAREEGKVVDFEGKQLAIYKNEEGLITLLSPVCTHAGCTVAFNQAEKSWDCPCHGGRFDVHGKVLCGPPQENLRPVEINK